MSLERKAVTAIPFPRVDVTKEDDFWQWYRQTLAKSGMVDGSPHIPGFFVLELCSFDHYVCSKGDSIRFLDNLSILTPAIISQHHSQSGREFAPS